MSSGFPFPSDRLALARSDFCEDPDASARTSWDATSCHIRARQCATHVQSTGDRRWAHKVIEPISHLLAPARVETWRATPGYVQGSALGGCQLMKLPGLAGEALGNTELGPQSVRAAYSHIAGDHASLQPFQDKHEGLAPTLTWGGQSWFSREYAKAALFPQAGGT